MLLVCEGKTEKLYFKKFPYRKEWIIHVEVSRGGDPGKVIEKAERYCERDSYRLDEGEKVWCVFDLDVSDNPKEAIAYAKNKGFGVAFSNPCFELWYLLHFQNHAASITCHNLKKVEMPKHIPGYHESMEGVFEILETKGNPTTARAGARSLQQHHANAGNPPHHNPSTTVDELVEFLNRLR